MEGLYEHSDWVLMGLGAFLVAMLVIGWYSSTKINGAEDYLVAGRGLGLFVLTGTMFATWFGAGTAMGGAGYAYLFGNQGIIFDPWGAAVVLIVVALFFAKLLRRGRYLTSVDFIQMRYGKAMALVSTIILVCADVGWLAAIILGGGSILAYFSGLEMATAVTLVTVIVTAYTLMGGMWAVALTDVWQMIILLVGMVLLLVFMLDDIPGGMSALFTNDTANWSQVNQWDFFPTPAENAVTFEAGTENEYTNEGFMYYTGLDGWIYFAASILTIGLGVIPTQSLMQRFLSAKCEKTGVRAGYISGLMYATVGMIPVMVGMIYFKVNPDLSINDAMNNILMYASIEYLPPVLTVLFMIALSAAIMSSADSIILAIAALIGDNLLKLAKPDANSEQVLKTTRIAVPVIAGVALVIALKFEAIYNLLVMSAQIAFVGIAMPFIFGFFWKRANQLGSLAAVVAGIAMWIYGYNHYIPMTSEMNTGVVEDGVVYQEWAMWDAIYMAGIWGVIASIIALVTVSLLTQKIDAPKPLLDIDGQPLKTDNFLGLPGFSGSEPSHGSKSSAYNTSKKSEQTKAQ